MTDANYTGQLPFDGLSDLQLAAVQSAAKMLDEAYWSGGFWRAVYAALAEVGDPPWLNTDVATAITTALAAMPGLTTKGWPLPADPE